jgi:hypothetical protein
MYEPSSSLLADTATATSQEDYRLALMAMADAFASSLVHQAECVFSLFRRNFLRSIAK